MLYPQQNTIRNLLDLSGLWNFQADPDGRGEAEGWFRTLPDTRSIAVPGSWNEQYEDLFSYLGAAWYQRSFYVPAGWQRQRIFLRVGSANYGARVWINGSEVGSHEGGHLPFEFEITDRLDWKAANLLAIRVENELKPARVPAGNLTSGLMAGFFASYPNTSFDFYPYAGLHRAVMLYAVPRVSIQDITTTCTIDGKQGVVEFAVRQTASGGRGRVRLSGNGQAGEAALAFVGGEARGVVAIENPRLWSPEDPFLYEAALTLIGPDGAEMDRYLLPIGIRTVQATADALLLNGKPVTLAGFGRHEDFHASGRGLNLPLLVKDYGLLKWVGANSYRTSHYPYSEEEMNLADRQGMLIIDEIPAVGLEFNESEEIISARLEMAQRQLIELVTRDKNHPSVVMWSVANEPMPADMIRRLLGGGADPSPKDAVGRNFLKTLIDLAHRLDPTRPATLVGVGGGPLEWLELADIVCINRYYGWYTQAGRVEQGARLLAQELDSLHEALHKPIILTEFGADAVAGMHSQPPQMFTEEYQVELLRAYLEVAAQRPYVIGTQVWNFADFKANQSVNRVGGMNLKGVFTRERQPKMAAHWLRERWSNPKLTVEAPAEAAASQPAELREAQEAQSADPLVNVLQKIAERLEGKVSGMTCTIGFDLEGQGYYRLVIADGKAHAEAGEGPTDAAIRLKPDDAVKLISGQLSPIAAVMTGRVKISGDMRALAVLQSI